MESAILGLPIVERHTEVPLSLAMRRGFLGHCPSCGQTPLFRSFLKQVPACSNCGAEFARIRADDAAPWLTIIAVGHLFMPLIFFIDLENYMPFWAGVTAWSAFFCGISLALLPRAKGLFIGLLWSTRAPGFDNG